jgi:hypothetical protein
MFDWVPTWSEILILWNAVRGSMLAFWGGIAGVVFTAIWIFWERAPMKRVFLTFFVVIFFLSFVSVWVNEYRDHQKDQQLYQKAQESRNSGMSALQKKLSEQPKASSRERAPKSELTAFQRGFNSQDEEAPYAREIFVTTNKLISAPFRLDLKCDKPIVKKGHDLVSAMEGNFAKITSERVNENIYSITVTTPNLTPTTSVKIIVFTKEPLKHCEAHIGDLRSN